MPTISISSKIEVQRESEIEKEKTRDANTQKCEKETVNRLECELGGSVVVFRDRKNFGVHRRTRTGGNGTGRRLWFCRRCCHEVKSVQRDEVGVMVTELDVEAVRTRAEACGMASGADERDGKTVARR